MFVCELLWTNAIYFSYSIYFNQNSETWFLDFEGKLQHSLKFLWSIRNETIKVFSAAPNYDDGNPLCQNILTKFSNISNLDASKWCEMWEPHLHINNTTSTNYSSKTRILPDKNNEIVTVSYSFLWFMVTLLHYSNSSRNCCNKEAWGVWGKTFIFISCGRLNIFSPQQRPEKWHVSHFCFYSTQL